MLLLSALNLPRKTELAWQVSRYLLKKKNVTNICYLVVRSYSTADVTKKQKGQQNRVINKNLHNIPSATSNFTTEGTLGSKPVKSSPPSREGTIAHYSPGARERWRFAREAISRGYFPLFFCFLCVTEFLPNADDLLNLV